MGSLACSNGLRQRGMAGGVDTVCKQQEDILSFLMLLPVKLVEAGAPQSVEKARPIRHGIRFGADSSDASFHGVQVRGPGLNDIACPANSERGFIITFILHEGSGRR